MKPVETVSSVGCVGCSAQGDRPQEYLIARLKEAGITYIGVPVLSEKHGRI